MMNRKKAVIRYKKLKIFMFIMLVISLATLQIFQLFDINTAYAKRVESGEPHKFTASQMRTFRESAQDFWGDRGELNVQGYPVDCTPRNVRVYYEYNVSGGYIARVKNEPFPGSEVGVVRNVFRGDANFFHGEAHEIMLNSYCKIWFNLAATYKYDTPSMCVAFIHEYGHLLGKNHVKDDKGSPMYNGYTFIDEPGVGSVPRHNDMARWLMKIKAKSWCTMRNAPHLINYPH